MAREIDAHVPGTASVAGARPRTVLVLLPVSAAVASTGLAAGGTAGALLGDQIAGPGASGLPPAY